MDAVLDSVNKMNTSAPISGEVEIAFFYNILVPDLLVWTSCISCALGVLVEIL